MTDGKWRERLQQAVADSGKSNAKIAAAAHVGHGYLTGVLKEGKDPTLEKFLAVVDATGASVAYVLLGLKLSPLDLELIRAFSALPESRQQGVLQFLGVEPDETGHAAE